MIDFQGIINITEEIITRGEFKEYKDLIKNAKGLDKNGVYIVKKKVGEIIYVGSAPKQTLRDRLIKGHLEGKNTALTRKIPQLLGQRKYDKKEYAKLSEKQKEDICKYLKDNCEFLVKSIDNFDEVLAVESLLILYFRRKKLELLNDYRE